LFAAVTGAGLWRSGDTGQSWTQCPGLPAEVYALRPVAERPGHVWAATDDGCWFSTDSGASWEDRGSGLENARHARAIEVKPGAPDTLLATKTQNVTIPWRPVADATCSPATAWRAGNGQCYNGSAFNATFDLTSLHVTLPSDVIVGVAYNTADYGQTPIGVAGPYNSLNVGAPNG